MTEVMTGSAQTICAATGIITTRITVVIVLRCVWEKAEKDGTRVKEEVFEGLWLP